jgi:peptidoglycan/LPS O-acetylase OafA/YrhL
MHIFDGFLKKNEKRIVGLDILRAIAILLVVYKHGRFLLPLHFHNDYLRYYINIDGVSIFFVLSGFLIGEILLKIINNSNFTIKDLLNFWIRRWFRTIPNYLIVLFAIILYQIIFFQNLGQFSFKYLFFLQNFISPHPGFFKEAWSLCVEEWFYILFPGICYLLHLFTKNKQNSILYSVLLFIIIPLLLRIIKYQLGIGIQTFDEEFRKIVVLRLDSIMYGVFASYIWINQKNIWIKYRFISLSLGIIMIALIKANPYNWLYFYKPFFFNIESITVLFLMPFFSQLKSTKIKFLDSLFIFISIISYSMYLLNLTFVQEQLIPITDKLIGMKGLPIEKTFLVNYLLYLFYTIFCSCLLYYFYENPMTRLRDKIKV